MTDARVSTVVIEVLGTVTAQPRVSALTTEVLGVVPTPTARLSTLTVEVLGVRSAVTSIVSSLMIEVLGKPGAVGLQNVGRTAFVQIKYPDGTWHPLVLVHDQ